MKIAVIVRVYNRLADLEICLDLIRKTWNRHLYYVIITANGSSDGYKISPSIRQQADVCTEIIDNSGHLSGNAELIKHGIKSIPSDCKYTVLLEADTWIYSDAIVDKYINSLSEAEAVWCSSEWIEKYYSLGLDFAIAESDYLVRNLPMFDFHSHAESFVCNYLLTNKQKFILLKEAMPVHIPKIMRYLYNPSGGRLRFFTRIPMVTHHIENLAEGIETKKGIANAVFQKNFFKDLEKYTFFSYCKFLIIEVLAKTFPRSAWFKKKKVRK